VGRNIQKACITLITQDIENLKESLLELIDGSYKSARLSRLVQLSRIIVEGYLRYTRSSLTILCVRQGLTITDVAYDCIAEAFARSDDNRFHQLENFTNSLNIPIGEIPPNQIFLAFKGFLIRITDAQLARLYTQSDPTGAKIHRNIRDCLNNSPNGLSLSKDFRGYVVRTREKISSDYLEEFPLEELEKKFLLCAKPTHSIPEMLLIIQAILIEQSSYRRSMPLIDVVQLVKKVYYRAYEEPDDQDHVPSFGGLSPEEIGQMRDEVEIVLKEKLLITYFTRGKLNRKQTQAMASAFRDLLNEWCDSMNGETSLYEHINNYIPMDVPTYEAAYRTKMEYLLKIARNEFAARLMREL
jgi:hypothetical protein